MFSTFELYVAARIDGPFGSVHSLLLLPAAAERYYLSSSLDFMPYDASMTVCSTSGGVPATVRSLQEDQLITDLIWVRAQPTACIMHYLLSVQHSGNSNAGWRVA